MKRNSMKTILSATLAAGLLAGSALGAPIPSPLPETGPGPQVSAFSVDQRTASPLLVWGQVKEKGEDSLYLENSQESYLYSSIRLTLAQDTLILDAVTGERKTLADIKENETLYTYVGPAMTRSLPPISTAQLVLCNIPQDFAVPTYAEIQSVTVGEDGKISALTDQDVILHLDESTPLTAFETKNAVGLADLVPGTKVLAWYSVATLSLPAQATPEKVMVFPYTYASYVTLGQRGILLDGDQALEGILADGKLLLPVRPLAEALGCTVAWDSAQRTATVSQGDAVLYTATIGGEAAQKGQGGLALTVAPQLVDGATYLALDDLLTLHNLKLAQ